jgi:type VI secretion system secreted protein Hcp
MSIDCHLKLDGVKGESTHDKHKDEVTLLSFTGGESNSSNSMGGGMAVGKGKAEPVHITMKYGTQSPVIAKHCVSGKHFKDATVAMSISGGKQEDFLTIVMKEVFIMSHSVSANANGEVIEQVTMNYADIEYKYKPQKSDGSLGGEVKYGVDMRTTVTR